MKKWFLSIYLVVVIPQTLAQQNAQDVIEKYTGNIGGKKAWQAIESFKMELTGKVGNIEFVSHQYMLKPNNFKMIYKYPNRERILSYNGIKGFITNNGVHEEMPIGMEIEMHEEADFYDELILYKEKGYIPRLEKDTILNNKEYFKINLYKNSRDTQWYYINKSNLLVEIIEEYSEEKKWKGTLFKTVINGYQKIDSVHFPKSMTLYGNDRFMIHYNIKNIILNPILRKEAFNLK